MKVASLVSAVRSMLRLFAVLVLFALGSCALLPQRHESISAPTVSVDSPEGRRGGWSVTTPDSLAAEFTQIQPRLGGQVGMAVMPVGGGRMTVFGDWTTGIAWSTIKVPLAIAALRHDPDGALDAAEAAITVSDNDAAEQLWQSLGDGLEAAQAVQGVLDEAGDMTTGIAGPKTTLDYTSFGSTVWALTEQARFASKLPCLPQTDAVTRLMGEITPEQGWGLGAIDGAEFKGGWGPDDDTGVYTVRQFGLLPTASGQVAVAVAAQADSGTYDDATALLDRLARLLDRHLDELRGGKCPSH